MTRLHQIPWRRCWVSKNSNRLSSIGRTDPRRDTLGGVDTHLKVGLKGVPILGDHLLNTQLIEAITRGGNTNKTSGVFRHKVHRGRSYFFGGENKVSFIFSVFIIHHHHHPTTADIGENRRYVVKQALFLHRTKQMLPCNG